jgi:hypothetical protein
MSEHEEGGQGENGSGAQDGVRGSGIEQPGTGFFVNGRELTKAQVEDCDRTIERARRAIAEGRPDRRDAPPSSRDLAEYHQETLKGLDADKDGYWRKVMEHHGFSWVPADEMNRIYGPMVRVPRTLEPYGDERIHDALGRPVANSSYYAHQPHKEGQWRNDVPDARTRPGPWFRRQPLGFTMADLVTMYCEPRVFDEWAKQVERKWRMAIAFRATGLRAGR